jgi:methylphosphotriester-DNA--protein-cysteine methyltransferase
LILLKRADKSDWKDCTSFSRLIKKEMGEKPIQIIIKTKLSLAFELLKFNPEMTCFEISRIIGKPDEKALNKFMKRHTGNPPSYFRNHIKASHFIDEQKKI